MLPRSVWQARQAAHEARVDAWLVPVLERARRGEKHPVEDFLFTYYRHRPAHLRRWSPGPGVVLEDGPDDQPWLEPPPDRVLTRAARTAAILRATASRPPQYGCSGLHEWAMVHRVPQDDVRHAAVPLRLGAAATTAVAERLPIRCSHFDAFRFFTDSARPLNALQPTRQSQVDLEQPGCLHATMDLYRSAYEISPWIAAETVADAFDLARRVRVLDMRASPYDLSALGLEPVRVETTSGRAEYAAAQRAFAEEAAPLRERVLAAAQACADRKSISPRT